MLNAPPTTAEELFKSLVEAPPDDTCRTCRFWAVLRKTEYWGRCANGNVILRVESEGVGTFYAHDFGCRFHRPKEAG
jgi:hypothetical protein